MDAVSGGLSALERGREDGADVAGMGVRHEIGHFGVVEREDLLDDDRVERRDRALGETHEAVIGADRGAHGWVGDESLPNPVLMP